jgi:transcriptional regulator with XRE-family HTH domain
VECRRLQFARLPQMALERDQRLLRRLALGRELDAVSKSHLCDIEKGRKTVSPERAAKWARVLGYPESVFVRLAIQGELDAAGLRYRSRSKSPDADGRRDRPATRLLRDHHHLLQVEAEIVAS